ncbi:MAG: 50S ribosomal protein L30 [Rhodothermales bacterium]
MGNLKITQTRSLIRKSKKQKLTMEALGFRRINQTVEHNDTPQLRGMLEKVHHLVKIEETN